MMYKYFFIVATLANASASSVKPSKCSGKYEVWSNCASCIPQTCFPEKYKDIMCPAVCREACVCIKGYVRDEDGNCIPEDKCPPKGKCSGKYEVWSKCASCIPQTCFPEKYKDIMCTRVCREACVCIKGYVRDEDGNCIPEDQCPPKGKCSGKYEVWTNCAPCIPQTCYPEKYENLMCKAPCREACVCIEGYVRGDDGKCIPKNKCPPKVSCTGKNEKYVQCPDCSPQTCSTRDRVYKCPVSNCNGACRCINGYYRNSKGECVSRKECETLEKCPAGEIYEPCPTVRCDADFCPRTRDYEKRCPVGIVCDPPRCVCEKGKVRNRHTNKCIPITDCDPFPCKGVNEVFKKCPSRSQLQTCEDLYNTNCNNDGSGGKDVCWPACVCKRGTYRNQNNKCVNPKSCLRPAILPAPQY